MNGKEELMWGRLDALVKENQSQQEMINLLHRITVTMDNRMTAITDRVLEAESKISALESRIFELEAKGDDGK